MVGDNFDVINNTDGGEVTKMEMVGNEQVQKQKKKKKKTKNVENGSKTINEQKEPGEHFKLNKKKRKSDEIVTKCAENTRIASKEMKVEGEMMGVDGDKVKKRKAKRRKQKNDSEIKKSGNEEMGIKRKKAKKKSNTNENELKKTNNANENELKKKSNANENKLKKKNNTKENESKEDGMEVEDGEGTAVIESASGSEKKEKVKKKRKRKRKRKSSENAIGQDGGTITRKKIRKGHWDEDNVDKEATEKYLLGFLQEIANEPSGQTLEGAKKLVSGWVNGGRLEQKWAGWLITKWKVRDKARRHKDVQQQNPNSDINDVIDNESSSRKRTKKTIEVMKTSGKKSDEDLRRMAEGMETQTLDDVKEMLKKHVKQGGLHREEAAEVVKKWKDRERRRVRRQDDKHSRQFCFNCRETGHLYADCPRANTQESGTGICFKCGSTEHISSSCQRRNVTGYPYATCFVCKRQGHISRNCDQNPNGIYPDGGSCNLCGSQQHLKKDCPGLTEQSSSNERSVFLKRQEGAQSADMDDAVFAGIDEEKVTKKGARKIVKF